MHPTGSENASAQNGKAANTVKQSRDRNQLQVFVGTWEIEGEQYQSIFGGPAKVTADESFEWLPGGKFLVHHLIGRVGAAEIVCIEVIDAARMPGGYRMHTFYNDGRSRDWLLTQNDDHWIIGADWSLPDGSKCMVRCTLRFEDAGRTRKGKWEVSKSGTWNTFWDVRATKKRA